VDFDGNGKTDIITGSYSPGDLYRFRRGPDGKFQPGEIIKDKNGKNIQFVASVPFAFDWNGDGLIDLIVGTINGEVWFIPNEGTPKQHAFGKPERLMADGKPIQVPHGDAGPVVTDWDGDGLPDLLIGCGDGSVQFYRNIGTRKEPRLAAPQTLVHKSPDRKAWTGELGENEWGARVKICVVDWNGDGKLDLLLGDRSSRKVNLNLTETEKTDLAKARQRYAKVQQEYQTLMAEERKTRADAKPKNNEAEQEEGERDRAQAERKKETERLLNEKRELGETLRKADPVQNAGYVFVFLRR
jgi:hypothetical protein